MRLQAHPAPPLYLPCVPPLRLSNGYLFTGPPPHEDDQVLMKLLKILVKKSLKCEKWEIRETKIHTLQATSFDVLLSIVISHLLSNLGIKSSYQCPQTENQEIRQHRHTFSFMEIKTPF